MYQLFSKRFESNNSIIRPPSFELVKRIYQREVKHIVDYYNNSVFYVNNTHLLVRLLTTAPIPLEYELDRFMEVASTRSPYLAKHFNFTSDINYGKFHNGVFYGEGNSELILYSEDYFNPYEELQDWKSIQAVTVIDHSISDLSLLLPNGKINSTDKGLAVIEVNIPLLLLQFRSFMLDQYTKIVYGSESVLGANHFVNMYVLPNMLYTHTNIAILNRAINIHYGAPMGSPLKRYPFLIVDYSNKADVALSSVLKRIQNNNMLYFSSLKNIPSIFDADMQESLLMSDIVKTRQVWWALLLSRFKVMKFLIDTGGSKGISNNRMYINKLKIDLKRLKEENIVRSLLPDDLYYNMKEDIEAILKL